MNTKDFFIQPCYFGGRKQVSVPLSEITEECGLAFYKGCYLHWSSWLDNDIVKYTDIHKNPTWEEIVHYCSHNRFND